MSSSSSQFWRDAPYVNDSFGSGLVQENGAWRAWSPSGCLKDGPLDTWWDLGKTGRWIYSILFHHIFTYIRYSTCMVQIEAYEVVLTHSLEICQQIYVSNCQYCSRKHSVFLIFVLLCPIHKLASGDIATNFQWKHSKTMLCHLSVADITHISPKLLGAFPVLIWSAQYPEGLSGPLYKIPRGLCIYLEQSAMTDMHQQCHRCRANKGHMWSLLAVSVLYFWRPMQGWEMSQCNITQLLWI